MTSRQHTPSTARSPRIKAHEVAWLKPKGARGLRARNAPARVLFRRVAATAWMGFLLTVSSAQTAFAPAAVAHTAADLLPARDILAEAIAAVQPLPDIAEVLLPAGRPAVVAFHAIDATASTGNAASGLDAIGPTLEPGADPMDLIAFGPMRVRRWIVETIQRAAAATGVDPVYLMAVADKESSFSPAVKAGTSSAEGLFQFVERTWLEVVRDFGPKHGLVAEAAAVRTVNGQITVPDDLREWVLGLRRDPYLSAVMAAEMKKRDRAQVQRQLGRDLSHQECYLAHLLGANGAARLLRTMSEAPKQIAPRVLPKAAKANRTIFFAREGRKTRGLTVAEVYERIDRMIDARLDRYESVAQVSPVAISSALP